jgi:hypothetical protein
MKHKYFSEVKRLKDLKGFIKNKRGCKEDVNIDPKKEADVKKTFEKYQNKSEGELMSELMRSVEQGKADGTFTPEALSSFIGQVSPMLNEEQKRKLKNITGKLR